MERQPDLSCKTRAGLRIFALVSILLFPAVYSVAQQKGAADFPKVLVFTRNGSGYVHDNIPAASECLRNICAANNLLADVTSDAAVFTSARLATYRIVIFANTNNQALATDDQRLAFRRYMEGGGKFMGIHSALGTERKWTWFKDMLGGTFDGHPPCQPGRILITDSKHPSVAGLPAPWLKRDECYLLKEVRQSRKVLMVHDLTAIKEPGNAGDKLSGLGQTYPAVWTDRFDGGLTWITALGHESTDYQDPIFIKHLENGLKFLMNEKLPKQTPYAKTKDDPIRKP